MIKNFIYCIPTSFWENNEKYHKNNVKNIQIKQMKRMRYFYLGQMSKHILSITI